MPPGHHPWLRDVSSYIVPCDVVQVRMLQQKLAGLGQPTVSMPLGMRSVDASHGAASSSTASPPASSAGGYHPGATSVIAGLPVLQHMLLMRLVMHPAWATAN